MGWHEPASPGLRLEEERGSHPVGIALGLSDLRKKVRPLKIFLGFGPGIA